MPRRLASDEHVKEAEPNLGISPDNTSSALALADYLFPSHFLLLLSSPL